MRSVVSSRASAVALLLLALAGCAEDSATETRTVTVRETVTRSAPPAPQPGLPRPVAEKRVAIARAAEANDYDALAALVDSEEFEYTFGGPVAGGPAAYWRQLEEGTRERPLQILHAILQMPYTRERGVYVWPFAFNKDLKMLTAAEQAMLHTIMTPQELRQMQQFGGYIGWRAGIRPDGRWIFYLAGD
jgi:hypothetical protein